jgi:hypothetical protein
LYLLPETVPLVFFADKIDVDSRQLVMLVVRVVAVVKVGKEIGQPEVGDMKKFEEWPIVLDGQIRLQIRPILKNNKLIVFFLANVRCSIVFWGVSRFWLNRSYFLLLA